MKVAITNDEKGKHQSWEAKAEHFMDGIALHAWAYGANETEARQRLSKHLTDLVGELTVELAAYRTFSGDL